MSLSTLRQHESPPPEDQGADAAAAAAPAARAAWAVMVIPTALLVWSTYAIWRAYSPTPFNDAWFNVLAWRDTPPDGWLTYLFSQHNEHRIVFPRLIFLADWQWFQGRGVLNTLSIGLIQLAGAAFFVAASNVRRLSGTGVLGLAAALALMVSLAQWENFFWSFQVAFVGVYASAAWAIYLFCLACDPEKRLRWGLMAGAMALLAVSTFNMANGVFAGVAMVALGLVCRRPAAIATAAVATAVLLAIYLHGYVAPPQHSSPAFALHHPGRFVTYVAVYLGGIWFPGKPALAMVAGLGGGAATAAMLLVLLRKDGRDPARLALFGVALFIGVTAASTSLGRLTFGVEQAMASRYMTATAYFWAALALFWSLTLARAPSAWLGLQRERSAWTLTLRLDRAVVLQIGLVLALALMLLRLAPLQILGDVQLKATHERILVASSALLGDGTDEDAIKVLYGDPTFIEGLLPFAREHRLALFADPPAAQVGAPFARTLSPPNACRGAFDGLAQAPGGAWRANGWGWDLQARRSFSRIVLVDGAGQVLGVGLSGASRKDVKKAVREVNDELSGWIASLRHGAGREVIAYGVTAGGAACELGRKTWPQ